VKSILFSVTYHVSDLISRDTICNCRCSSSLGIYTLLCLRIERASFSVVSTARETWYI
jgi:hypothetical protein